MIAESGFSVGSLNAVVPGVRISRPELRDTSALPSVLNKGSSSNTSLPGINKKGLEKPRLFLFIIGSGVRI